MFLFQIINVSPDRYIDFSEYLHFVISFCLSGKLDVMKIVFKFGCKDSSTYILREGWSRLLDTMLSNENIPYPKRGALHAFDQLASRDVHGSRLLYFNDFQKVSTFD